MLLFFCTLIYPKNKVWHYGYDREFKILIQNKIDALYFIAPFLILPIFCQISPTIVFLKFDFYTKEIVAWFIFALIWLNKYYHSVEEKKDYLSHVFYFFIFTSCALWILMIWHVGAGALLNANMHSNRLANIFYYIWEHKPFSSHFLMSFHSIENYNQKIAYTGYSPPFLLLMYIYSKTLAIILGVTLEFTTKTIPILYSFIFSIAFIFSTINERNKASLNKPLIQFSVFCVLGILLSIPTFWIPFMQSAGNDNVFPMVMYFTLFLFVYVRRQDFTSKWYTLGLFSLCLLVPVHGILMLPTLAFYALRKDNTNEHRMIITILLLACAVAVLTFLYPITVAKLLHYKSNSSSFLFRSGLDGDVRYYKNMLQSVTNPIAASYIRPYSSLIPELIFLVIAYVIGGKFLLQQTPKYYSDYLFLFFPYLLTLVFWPQAVSIHPYLYDFMLELPLFFVSSSLIISSPVQQRISGPNALLFILGLVSLLMYNFTMIAQAAKIYS